jgi:hypothetical protein
MSSGDHDDEGPQASRLSERDAERLGPRPTWIDRALGILSKWRIACPADNGVDDQKTLETVIEPPPQLGQGQSTPRQRFARPADNGLHDQKRLETVVEPTPELGCASAPREWTPRPAMIDDLLGSSHARPNYDALWVSGSEDGNRL